MIVCPTLNRASGVPEWFNLLDYMVRLDLIRLDSGINSVARWSVAEFLRIQLWVQGTLTPALSRGSKTRRGERVG